MEFTWLNKQGVKSSNGFVLQRIDRFHYNYVEGDQVMKIKTDNDLIENLCLGAEPKWELPYSEKTIPAIDVERIILNIHQAMAFMQVKCRVLIK